MANYTLPRRLYVTKPLDAEENELVEEGDPRAAYVLGGEGSQISEDLARRVGLLPQDAAPADEQPADEPGPFARMMREGGGRGVGSPAPAPAPPAEDGAEDGDTSADADAETNGKEATVAEVLARAQTVTDPAEIQRLLDSESAQEKPRKSLVEGLNARLKALSAPPENKAVQPSQAETK